MALDLLTYQMMFETPQMLSGMSAWVGHIPFAMALVQMVRPRTLVELGTHAGDSYMAFCQAVALLGLPTRCSAVDTWQGDSHAGQYGQDVMTNLARLHDSRYGRFSTLVRSTFDSAVTSFLDDSIDLLHIDGLHTYEAVRHDFDTWLPKLSPSGVILFHDTAEKVADFGVWRLWSELSGRYPSFAFDHCHGLGLLAVGENVPPQLLAFLQMASQRPAEVRRLFATLGDRLQLRDAMARALAPIHEWRTIAQNWRQRVGVQMQTLPVDPRQAEADPVGYIWAGAREAYVVAEQDLQLRQTNVRLETELRRLRGETG